jgi:TPR repeat protein
MTYDPMVLTQLGVVGVRGNSALARHWYQRAQDAGDPEAAERFETLHGP